MTQKIFAAEQTCFLANGHKARAVRLALQAYCRGECNCRNYLCTAAATALFPEENLSRESRLTYLKDSSPQLSACFHQQKITGFVGRGS